MRQLGDNYFAKKFLSIPILPSSRIRGSSRHPEVFYTRIPASTGMTHLGSFLSCL